MSSFGFGSVFSWWPSSQTDSLPPLPTQPANQEWRAGVDAIIDDTNRQVAELKAENGRKVREMLKRPIPITRDFSSFPFPQLELDTDDKNSIDRSHSFKFQTSYYVAYVHHLYQNYVQPEHLDNPADSLGMREARKNLWGSLSGKESYQIREQYPEECSEMDELHAKICHQEIRDNKDAYGDEIVDGIDNIERKYTQNRTWRHCKEFFLHNEKVISFVALAAIGTTIFFCLPPEKPSSS